MASGIHLSLDFRQVGNAYSRKSQLAAGQLVKPGIVRFPNILVLR